MAKNKRNNDAWDTDSVDDLLDALFDKAKGFYGNDAVFTGSEAEQRIVGLAFPAFSLRYLFQSTVFPLSRMTQLVGTESSGKSTLLYEMFRWFKLFGGKSVLLENETKDSPELRNSLLDYDYKSVIIKPCNSLEEWQDGLIRFINWTKEMLDGTASKPGPGRIRPLCCGIDSLMAKASMETDEKISKLGYAERSFPIEANLISSFMKVMPQKLADIPACVVGINHMKPGTDNRGRPTKNIPGGRSLKFQETYEIELARIAEINKKAYSGYTVKLFTKKNSLGQDRKAIFVDILRWYEKDPITGEMKMRTIWNWEAASITLLLEFQKNKDVWKEISEVCDLHPVRTSSNRVWSNALGISPDDAATYRDAGIALEQHPEIMNELYKILCIKKRMAFVTGEDYRDQRKRAGELAAMDEASEQQPTKPAVTLDSDDVTLDLEEDISIMEVADGSYADQ